MDDHAYRTIERSTKGQFKDRGSKFLSFAYPVNSAAEVKEKVLLLKKEHPKAVHHCYAYRLGTNGTQYRANDDGEPSGSAGRPILGQIDSLGLTHVLVVVVRYFGGILLGIPGLINAYKTAAAAALKDAVIVEKWIEEIFEISFDYPDMNEVLHILKQNESKIIKQDPGLFCIITAGIPLKNSAGCVSNLKEIPGVNMKRI